VEIKKHALIVKHGSVNFDEVGEVPRSSKTRSNCDVVRGDRKAEKEVVAGSLSYSEIVRGHESGNGLVARRIKEMCDSVKPNETKNKFVRSYDEFLDERWKSSGLRYRNKMKSVKKSLGFEAKPKI
jgi:hypothetical protein